MSVMEGVCNVNGEEPELVAQACVLSEFSENDETRAIISSLPDIHHDTVSRETTIEKFLGKTVSCIRICLSYRSIYLSVCLSVSLSLCLCVCLSVSVCLVCLSG